MARLKSKTPDKGYIIIHLETGLWDGIYTEDLKREALQIFKSLSAHYYGRWVLAQAIEFSTKRSLLPDHFLTDNWKQLDAWNKKALEYAGRG